MQAGFIIAERFRIGEIAGRGGMGVVYRAFDLKTQEPVAVKLMTRRGPSQTERFAREIWMLSELSHPHIVRYIASGEVEDEGLYLVMEWLEGEDVSRRLSRGTLSIEDSLRLVQQVAAALGFAHQKGIVHRDIKPQNLYLTDGQIERVKILDFGIARPQDPLHEMTRTGIIMGTPGYLAPEQATRGAKGLDARADVFALGCVLFECIVGRPAFVGENFLAVLSKVLLADPPKLSTFCAEVPEGLEALLTRMLAKDPAKRPADGTALAAELAAIVPSSRVRVVAATQHLTEGERRFIGVVLLSRATTLARSEMDTLPALEGSFDEALRSESDRFTARLDFLLDGSALVTFSGTGVAVDQAMQAARCALALSAKIPAVISLALGLADVSQQLPVGEAIDRAVRLLQSGSSQNIGSGVWIDEVTSGFLGDRFELESSAHGTKLLKEIEELDTERTLLGRRIPCVGRERELAALEAAARECQEESAARVVLVVGPAGIGKTKLRQEFMRRVGSGFEVFASRGDSMRQGSAFGVLAPALRRAAKILEGEPLEVSRKKLQERVYRHLPEGASVVGFLGEILGLGFPDDDNPVLRAARQDAQLMGEQLQRAFLGFIRAELQFGPLIFLVEDLHWGDLPTIKFLDNALREFTDLPLFVLAFARPEVRGLFPELFAERAPTEIRLGELSKKAAERLVRSALGEQADAALITRLVERGSTNALYLEELCRAAAAGEEELPATVLAMVSSRLEGLPAEVRRLGRAASIFGEIFPLGAITALVGNPDNLQATLQQLSAKELVSRRGESRFVGEEEWSFRHNLFREGFYAMLTDEDRALGHRMVGEWLEQKGENNALLLATHFEKAGDKKRALAYLVEATERANQATDHPAVLALVKRAIALGAEGIELGALLAVEAYVYAEIGDFVEGNRAGQAALALLPPDDRRWFQIAGWVVMFSGVLRDFAVLQEVLGRLFDAPLTSQENLPAQIQALSGTCWFFLLTGQGAQAKRFLAKLEEAAQNVHVFDPATETWLHQARGQRALFLDDYPERAYREVLMMADSSKTIEKWTQHYYGRLAAGEALSRLGRAAEALAQIEPLMREAEQRRIPIMLATSKRFYGNALLAVGRLEEAVGSLEEAIQILVAMHNPFDEADAQRSVAKVRLGQGDLEKAEAAARRAFTLPGALFRIGGAAMLARVLVRKGNPQEALEVVTAGEETARENLLAQSSEMRGLLLAKAEALTALGSADATAAREAARTHLLQVADTISTPELRESFLSQIPEHTAILNDPPNIG